MFQQKTNRGGLFGNFAQTSVDRTAALMPTAQERVSPFADGIRQAMQPKTGGFFGEGGIGRGIAGTIGDYLMQANGMQPIYQPTMQHRQMLAQQQKMAEQERANAFQDWQMKKQWERDNPAPINNDTVNDFNWYKGLSDQDRALYDQQHPVVVQGPDGPYVVPRSSIRGNAAIGGASLQSDWDSATPMGGTSGNAGGGFPVGSNHLDRVTVQSESAGNPNAVSPKGAMGLWQVMPATARDPGFGITPWNGTPGDLNRVGQQYRQKMQTRYGGDLSKMWAAYNWGPGAVDKAIAAHGSNWLNHAPAETRAYVARNLRAVRGGK